MEKLIQNCPHAGDSPRKINIFLVFVAIIPSIVLTLTLLYSFIQVGIEEFEKWIVKILPSGILFSEFLQVGFQVALLLASVFVFNKLISLEHPKKTIYRNNLFKTGDKCTVLIKQLLIAVVCENLWCWFCLRWGTNHPVNTTENQIRLNHLAHGSNGTVYFFIVLVLVIAPLCEEFIFRFVIFNLTRRCFDSYRGDNSSLLAITLGTETKNKYSCISAGFTSPINWWAWVYSSILFAFLHTPTTLSAFDLYFGLGMIIGWFYVRYNSPRASVLCHLCINATNLLIMML